MLSSCPQCRQCLHCAYWKLFWTRFLSPLERRRRLQPPGQPHLSARPCEPAASSPLLPGAHSQVLPAQHQHNLLAAACQQVMLLPLLLAPLPLLLLLLLLLRPVVPASIAGRGVSDMCTSSLAVSASKSDPDPLGGSLSVSSLPPGAAGELVAAAGPLWSGLIMGVSGPIS
jgi:hypothetical protein